MKNSAILVFLTALAVLVSCKRAQETTQSLEDLELRVQEELRLKKEADATERDREKAATIKKKMAELRNEENEELPVPSEEAPVAPTAQSPGELTEEDWARIEEKMVARYAAQGRKFKRLVTRDGTVYQDAVINGTDAKGLTIVHQDGRKDLRYDDLPPELQTEFYFDAAEAEMLAQGGTLPAIRGPRARAVRERVEALKASNAAAARDAELAALLAGTVAAPQEDTSGLEDSPEAKRLSEIEAVRREAALTVSREVEILSGLIDAAARARDVDANGNIRRARTDPKVQAADKKVEAQRVVVDKAKAAHAKAEALANALRKDQL